MSSRASTWRKCLFAFPAYWAGIPVILHLHGSDMAVFYEKECGPAKQRLIKTLFDRAARLVVLSESWAEWLRAITANPGIVAIYNPVIVPPATPWTARHPGEVLFLGRLGERKGAYDLVAGFAQAHTKHPHSRMLMGGDGEVAEVKAAADAAGCGDAVTMLGWVRGNDRDRTLAQAMIYALPSYREGLPMGLLEAMAAGLPVLTCPIAGIPEAVDDSVEGFLVTPGDSAAIADRLQRLIGDPALAERMGAAARARVERCFSAEAIIPQVEKIYADLLRR
jgi:glycosyltransferase involved in cell wall biosynthesis